MKKKFFGANWKMNHSIGESKEFLNKLRSLYDIINSAHDIVIFPPMHLLALMNKYTQFLFFDNHNDNMDNANKTTLFPSINLLNFSQGGKTSFFIGAQNFYCADQGAFTGEVSADMLVKDSIKTVIIGHSERRTIFNENDELINQKLKWAMKNRMYVVLCCGEPIEIRDANTAKDYVSKQLEKALSGIDTQSSDHIIIAYEPIWAIGTGKTPTREQIEEMHVFILQKLKELGFNDQVIRVIYGGSVNKNNAGEILSIPSVDGNLIGSASLDAQSLVSIIESV